MISMNQTRMSQASRVSKVAASTAFTVIFTLFWLSIESRTHLQFVVLSDVLLCGWKTVGSSRALRGLGAHCVLLGTGHLVADNFC